MQKTIENRLSSEAGSIGVGKEQEQVNALFTLLENRYMKKVYYTIMRWTLSNQDSIHCRAVSWNRNPIRHITRGF